MRRIERTPTGANDRPKVDVTIADSGEVPVEEPFSYSVE